MNISCTLHSSKYGALPVNRELNERELALLAQFALNTLYVDQCAMEQRRPNDAEFADHLIKFFELRMKRTGGEA